MRPILSGWLIASLTWFGFAQAVPPGDLIPLGTGVEIELLEDISSETLQPSQSVRFKLVRALERNGVTLATADTPFTGRVASANPAGHWKKAGAFDLRLEPLKLANEDQIRLDFHRPTRLNTRSEKTGETIGSAIVMTYYFPLIPVALLSGARKGKPFKIRSGERYLVYVVGVEGPSATTEAPKP